MIARNTPNWLRGDTGSYGSRRDRFAGVMQWHTLNEFSKRKRKMENKLIEDTAGNYAVFSDCERYRYLLYRQTGARVGVQPWPLIFVMLNPSTADAFTNDPTIRKCMRFAVKWGFSDMYVLNLFAWRSTDKTVLTKVDDPVGPHCDQQIQNILGFRKHHRKRVVCGWGALHKKLENRASEFIDKYRGNNGYVSNLYSLGTNQDGSPRHPLYLPLRTQLYWFPEL